MPELANDPGVEAGTLSADLIHPIALGPQWSNTNPARFRRIADRPAMF